MWPLDLRQNEKLQVKGQMERAGLAQPKVSWKAAPPAPQPIMSLQKLCGLKVEPTPNRVYKHEVTLPLFSAWLDAQKALGLGVGTTMKGKLGGSEPVQRGAQRGSVKSCGERLKNSGTFSWGKGELNEEPAFSLTVMC